MDRSRAARVCSLSPFRACDRSAGSMPAASQPRGGSLRRGSRRGRARRPKLARGRSPRIKRGQSARSLLGEAPVDMPRVEELLRSLMQGLPPGLASGASGLREDLENNFRAVLRANLGKLDLAGRDEFDAQRKVLERTRT